VIIRLRVLCFRVLLVVQEGAVNNAVKVLCFRVFVVVQERYLDNAVLCFTVLTA